MKIKQVFYEGNFDIAFFGLGYESRAISSLAKYSEKCDECMVLGYDTNTDKFNYQSNKKIYGSHTENIFEANDSQILDLFKSYLVKKNLKKPVNVLVDITVMSRHRLATVICTLIDNLPLDSTINITYSLSNFVDPPLGSTPVRKVGEIAEGLGGALGDLGLPTTLILGLGYEKSKALGVSNYLDSWRTYIFLPQSPIPEFEIAVKKNNRDFIDSIPQNHIFYYDVCSPYSTYLDLRALVLSAKTFSRPLLIPLGPKVLSALCVILGKEMHPDLPIWRVSSEHTEMPVDRPASGIEIKFTVDL